MQCVVLVVVLECPRTRQLVIQVAQPDRFFEQQMKPWRFLLVLYVQNFRVTKLHYKYLQSVS